MKPVVLRSGDAEVFVTWWDSELRAQCVVDTEGPCRPHLDNRLLHAGDDCLGELLVVQADTSCSEGMPDWHEPRLAQRPSSRTECGPVEVTLLGAPAQRPTHLSGGPMRCEAWEVSSDTKLFEQGPAGSLVVYEASVEPRAPGLDAHVMRAPDGAWFISNFHDPVHQWSCETSTWRGPEGACLPVRTASPGTSFVDPGCGVWASGYGEASPCRERPRALQFLGEAAGECSRRPFALFMLEGPFELEVFRDGIAGCVSDGVQNVLRQGPQLDPFTLPIIETVMVGTGRLQALYEGFGGVAYRSLNAFFDSEIERGCTPRRLSDGAVMSCVPEGFRPVVARGFSDDACMGEAVYGCGRLCGREVDALLVSSAECASKYSPFEALPYEASTVYVRRADGSCVEESSLLRDDALFLVGEAIDPRSFPELEYAILE